MTLSVLPLTDLAVQISRSEFFKTRFVLLCLGVPDLGRQQRVLT
jgi:hypothetical protein